MITAYYEISCPVLISIGNTPSIFLELLDLIFYGVDFSLHELCNKRRKVNSRNCKTLNINHEKSVEGILYVIC